MNSTTDAALNQLEVWRIWDRPLFIQADPCDPEFPDLVVKVAKITRSQKEYYLLGEYEPLPLITFSMWRSCEIVTVHSQTLTVVPVELTSTDQGAVRMRLTTQLCVKVTRWLNDPFAKMEMPELDELSDEVSDGK